MVSLNLTRTNKILFVDDDPVRHESFLKNLTGFDVTQAFTYSEAVDALSSGPFDVVFLDHDLGDFQEPEVVSGGYGVQELTGLDVAGWMVAELDELPQACVIHSANPVGAENIEKFLTGKCNKVIRMSFPELLGVIK